MEFILGTAIRHEVMVLRVVPVHHSEVPATSRASAEPYLLQEMPGKMSYFTVLQVGLGQ